jgi:hypothetical protein
MKVIFTPDTLLYLEELAQKLYLSHYFGCIESAHQYLDELVDEIENGLPYLNSKEAPRYFDRYGQDMFYATFRKNKNTYWYVFFKKYRLDGEIIFQVRFIGNNHTIAQYL